MKAIIIPDVHGRKFWEIAKSYKDIPIIFLGDYLDPYPSDNTGTSEDCINNFKSIIEFAKSNDNVKLLLGNHDLTYYSSTDICECRTIYKHYDEIEELFLSNKDLFNFIYRKNQFVLSHAGITPGWADNAGFESIDACIEDSKNWKALLDDNNSDFLIHLSKVSRYRGGNSFYGSPVWSDVEEHLDKFYLDIEVIPSEYIQIFGHTYMKQPVHISTVKSHESYCLDCGAAFYIDDDDSIKCFDSSKKFVEA